MKTISYLWRGWESFWFQPADPTPLGFVHICCGLVVLYVHLVYTLDLDPLLGAHAWIDPQAMRELRLESPVHILPSDWVDPSTKLRPPPPERETEIFDYGKRWGVDPRVLYTKGVVCWSIWFHIEDPTAILILHLLILVVMGMFTVGFCTRITSALTWLAAISYIQRSPSTLFGMDTIMNVTLIYLMIGPSGAALSVDRLLARRRAPDTVPAKPGPLAAANFTLRMMQVHFCIIYLASGLSKLQGTMWWNGTALWGTMANPEFAPLHQAWYEGFLAFLCRHRWLWELVISSGVVFTLALEIGFPFLVWDRRIRWLMVLLAVLLHVGIAMSMGLMSFGLMMLTLLASFLPPEAIHRFVEVVVETGRSFVGRGAPAVERSAA